LVYQSGSNVTLNAEVGKMFPYLKTSAWQRDDVGRIVVDSATGWPNKAAAFAGQGGTQPKYQLGIGFNIRYKSFTLTANAEYRGGYIVYNSLGETSSFTGSGALTTLNAREQFVWPNSSYLSSSGKYVANTNIAIDNWHAIYAGYGDLGNGSGFPNIGEMYFSSGAFWKLRDVALTFDLPASVLKNFKSIKGISLQAWGRNLVTVLAKDNYFMDPELSNTTGTSQGISTTGNTPTTRQIGGTIRITF
jgi:hypothetical protein